MKNVKKENLAEKTCLTCNKPFTWRKKWEKVWDEVKYCSDKCRMNKKKALPEQPRYLIAKSLKILIERVEEIVENHSSR